MTEAVQRALVCALVAAADEVVARVPTADACDVVGEALRLAEASAVRAALVDGHREVYAAAWNALRYVRGGPPPPTSDGAVAWFAPGAEPPLDDRVARFVARANARVRERARYDAAYRRSWARVS